MGLFAHFLVFSPILFPGRFIVPVCSAWCCAEFGSLAVFIHAMVIL
jgi:hypothetical protein